MNRQTVADARQFFDALKKADLKAGVSIGLISGGAARQEILKSEAR